MLSLKDIRETPELLDDIFTAYELYLKDVDVNLRLEGKKLEFANRENPTWQNYYDQKRSELTRLTKLLETEVERIRGSLFKTSVATIPRDMSDRAREKYIDNEPAYLNVYERYIQCEELLHKYQAVVEAFRSRGYALNNITRIRVAQIDDQTL